MAAPNPPPGDLPSQATLPEATSAGGAGPQAVPAAGAIAENTTETIYQSAIEPADDSETSSAFEDDGNSATSTSITSSIKAHVYENGRRYHKFRSGAYTMPNDEAEQDREDMKHAAVERICDGKLIFSPIGDNPQNIIDLGTGTGIWAIEVAELYPSAEVIGVDLSPIQPEWVPPNLKFLVDDIEDEFVYPQNHFDLIHMRHVIHHLRNPQQLVNRCFTHLKPGGWVEVQEHEIGVYCDDGTMPPDYPPITMFSHVAHGMRNFGLDPTGIMTIDDKLREAGFINISRKVYKIPSGPWPKGEKMKMIGLFWRTVILEGLEGISAKTIGVALGWSKEEIDVFLVGVRKAVMDRSVHSYWPLHIVTAQKPL